MAVQYPTTEAEYDLIPGAVKAAVKGVGATSADLWMVPPDEVVVLDGFNVRITGTKEYEDGIEALKRSIMVNGYYRDKPLTCFVGKNDDKEDCLFLTDGHRRLQAINRAIAEGAEIERVPVLVKPPGTHTADLVVAMTQTGEPLKSYEVAVVCKRLIGYNMEPDEIAKRLGITRRHVDNHLLLAGAPAAIRKMVTDGTISATTAVEELRANSQEAVERLEAGVETAKANNRTRTTPTDVKKAAEKKQQAAKPKGKKAAAAAKQAEHTALKGEWEFKARAGDIRTLDDIQLFQAVAGGTWYETVAGGDDVTIVQDIRISLKMTRKAKPVSLAEEAADL